MITACKPLISKIQDTQKKHIEQHMNISKLAIYSREKKEHEKKYFNMDGIIKPVGL